MPMYDFRCLKCGAIFERLSKMDAAPPPCPECGGATERKLTVESRGPADRVDMKSIRFHFNYMER